MLKEAIARLVLRQDLGRAEISGAFEEIFAGHSTPAQIAGFLVALRMKGETPEEIAGAAEAMRRNATRVRVPAGRVILDTCGTGGDGSHTFNISTAVAFVAAAAGATVAKHGNRSVSSSCGSADVLSAAGVNIQAPVALVERCLEEIGIGFLFAPSLHEVMKHVIGPRRELGVRSVFNLLGPLANPAGATHQLIIGCHASARPCRARLRLVCRSTTPIRSSGGAASRTDRRAYTLLQPYRRPHGRGEPHGHRLRSRQRGHPRHLSVAQARRSRDRNRDR